MTLRTPAYRHHRPSGQAVVTLNGRDHYLGPYGTPESKSEYDRLVAEWLTNGRRLALEPNRAELTINELILALWSHVEQHYRHADRTPTSEVANYRDSLRLV